MSIVTRVEQSYYELIFAREDVKVQEKAHESAERVARGKPEARRGQGPWRRWMKSRRNLSSQQSRVAHYPKGAFGTGKCLEEFADGRLCPMARDHPSAGGNLMAVPAIFDVQESWQKGLRNRPDLLQFRLDVESSDIDIRLRRNQLLPEFDLVEAMAVVDKTSIMGLRLRTSHGPVSLPLFWR